MCMESPGPRCADHVKQELDELHKESKDIFAALQDTQREMTAVTEAARAYRQKVGTQTDAETIQKNIAAIKKAAARISLASEEDRKIRAKIRSKEAELDATADGLQHLKEIIAQQELQGEYVEELKDRLTSGEKLYKEKVALYDAEHKTVNMQQPSLDGNDQGIERLGSQRKRLEKKFAEARNALLANEDPSQDERLKKVLDSYGKKIENNKNQLNLAVATDKLIKQGILGDPRKIAELREMAAQAEKRKQESCDRSDTDGFTSQWASGLAAQEALLKAELEENAGKASFVALFDMEGNMVPAKWINTKYGWAWARYSDPHDSSSKFTGEFINESSSDNPKTKAAALARKGYTLGRVKAPAYVVMSGANTTSVRPIFVRVGKDIFDRYEVITKNIYDQPKEK